MGDHCVQRERCSYYRTGELSDLTTDLGQREHIVVHYSPVVNYCALSVLDLGQRERIVVHYSPVVNYNAVSLS